MKILILTQMAVLLTGGSLLAFLGSFWWGLFFFSGGLMMLFGFKYIPSDPPHVGLPTIWGKRINEVRSEGWTLLAPYFPYLYGVMLINITKKNRDFIFSNVRCIVSEDVTKKEGETKSNAVKSGGAVEVTASITWVPDKDSLIAYTDSGGQTGVEQIIEDRMAEVIRGMGRKKTWEQMTFATEIMSANLILSIVGTKIKDENGKEWSFGEEVTEENVNEATAFLSKVLKNGLGDDHDLGIKIRRLNIKKVEPEGELKKDAEKSAREVQDKRAEV
ncbi:MAG: hypothetical protein KAS02_01850, partial [Candidatus Pacebacteria bacterium]|nr:hypothetical protein [Candidatus Paceibacterota bacterium]